MRKRVWSKPLGSVPRFWSSWQLSWHVNLPWRYPMDCFMVFWARCCAGRVFNVYSKLHWGFAQKLEEFVEWKGRKERCWQTSCADRGCDAEPRRQWTLPWSESFSGPCPFQFDRMAAQADSQPARRRPRQDVFAGVWVCRSPCTCHTLHNRNFSTNL